MPCPCWGQPVAPHGSDLHRPHFPEKCDPNLQLREVPGLLRAPGIWRGVGSREFCLLRAQGSLRTPCSGIGGCRAQLPFAAAWGLCLCRASSAPHSPPVSVPTFPLILVIPNPISTDLIFTSKSRMNMLNIIIP